MKRFQLVVSPGGMAGKIRWLGLACGGRMRVSCLAKYTS